VTPSNAHGLAYESWEWTGCTARSGFNLAASVTCKPTRMDDAFDFPCDPDFYPDDLINALRPGIIASGYTEDDIGSFGPLRTGSRSVGSRTSAKYLRIYRRDLKNGEGPPVIRVELEAKDDAALKLWNTYHAHGLEAMHRAAASMIEGMCGWSPIPPGPIESLPPEEPTTLDDTTLAMFRQYGTHLAFLAESGFDVLCIASDYNATRTRDQRAKYRRASKLLDATGGPDALAERIRAVLRLETAS
jgi:hypothetical protein